MHTAWFNMSVMTNQTQETDMTPDELGALKKLVGEFISRMQNIDNEMDTLKEMKRDLIAEFKPKLDTKTLAAAMKVIKIQSEVEHRDTFDAFMEVLVDDVTNGLVS